MCGTSLSCNDRADDHQTSAEDGEALSLPAALPARAEKHRGGQFVQRAGERFLRGDVVEMSVELLLRGGGPEVRLREPVLDLLVTHVPVERKGVLLDEPAREHESSAVACALHRAARELDVLPDEGAVVALCGP